MSTHIKSITESSTRVVKQEADPRFPYGSITLSFPDWNNLVSHVFHVHQSLMPLKRVLAHVELSSPPQNTGVAVSDAAESLWSAFHTLDVLVREIKTEGGYQPQDAPPH